MKVNFNDAGLYAVFVSEILGQFSDGYWENSRNRDYRKYSSEETFLGDSSIEKAPTRYTKPTDKNMNLKVHIYSR